MRVYDARYGWGTVVEDNNYHVVVQFDHTPEYTREYVKIKGEDENLKYRVQPLMLYLNHQRKGD